MILKKSLIAIFAGFIFCLASLMIPSCTHAPVGIELLDTVCFAPTVMGIIQSSCGSNGTTKCHDGSMEGWSIYDTASIMSLVNTPGNPKGCKLYQVITDINGENFMPPGHAISKENRTLIEVWIAQGAMQNTCGTAPVDTGGGSGTLKECTDSIYFQQKILPFITAKCSWCHDGTTPWGEDIPFKMDSYETIIPYVNTSDPASSPVYTVLSASGEELMPPPLFEPASTSEKDMLLKWITEGARNNSCTSGICDTTGTITFTAMVDPIIQFYCIGCHSSPTQKNLGVDLSTYENVKTVAQTLHPNTANGTSRLVGVINRMPDFWPMPAGYSLDQCTIRTIELWIKQGMLK
jgi:uncharacterized membrane protein